MEQLRLNSPAQATPDALSGRLQLTAQRVFETYSSSQGPLRPPALVDGIVAACLPHLPESLEPLREVALNLGWSYDERAIDLVRRIEEKFPPKGGAPEAPPLPEVELVWERKGEGRSWLRYVAAALGGAGLVWLGAALGMIAL